MVPSSRSLTAGLWEGEYHGCLSAGTGGADRDRTGDLSLARRALCLLSYSPRLPGTLPRSRRCRLSGCQRRKEEEEARGSTPAGAGSRNRTDDLMVTNHLLYLLSYTGIFRAAQGWRSRAALPVFPGRQETRKGEPRSRGVVPVVGIEPTMTHVLVA